MVEKPIGVTIRRNVIFNVLGGVWAVALNLVSIPFELRILGVEAFGLVGFVTTLQIVFVFLDFGLTTTLIREIAADDTPGWRVSQQLVQTASTIYWSVAAIVGIAVLASAGWVTTHWLTFKTLDTLYVTGAMRLLAVALVLTWPVTLYNSVLAGLQRLDIANVLKIGGATLNTGGGLAILLWTKDFYTFLIWSLATAAVITLAYGAACSRLLPSGFLIPGFHPTALRRVRRFSADLYLLGILGVFLTQTDRLLISHFLSLAELGYYNLASSIARLIAMLQEFINSAVLPALSRDYRAEDPELLGWRYNKYSQMMIYLVTLPSAILIFFGESLLGWFTRAETATYTAPVLALLAAGALLNGTLSPSYTLTIVAKRTNIPLIVNIIGTLIYLPGLYLLMTSWGLIGAGLAWILLNSYYLVVFLPAAHSIIPKTSTSRWILRNLAPFYGLAFGLFFLAKHVIISQSPLVTTIIAGLAALVYIGLGFAWLDPSTRQDILASAWKFVPSRRTV